MLQNKNVRTLFIVMVLIFSVTFYFGVFANPNFNVHDFCMNLSSEILGLAIALIVVDAYVSKKKAGS